LLNKNKLSSLKEYYKKFRTQIIARKKEFKRIGRCKKYVFRELCFCILTPQAKAEKCWSAVKELFRRGFPTKTLSLREVRKILKHNVRFYQKKASYLVSAAKNFDNLWEVLNKKAMDGFAVREEIIKAIKGVGYKEASHFLRNIGHSSQLAILDRHILKNLRAFGIIKEVPKNLTKKTYLKIEEKMIKFSKKVGIPVVDLDLLLWAKEAGYVFK
jgi:N-glycosylase/DNA lyase